MRSYKYIVLFLMFISASLIYSQNNQNIQYKRYIETYKDVAIKKMQKFKIPASITLAQGILESNAGNSFLAKSANNHFGIKCYDGWNGDVVRKNDDKRKECFKKYNTVSDSFDDHSKFLQRDRYKNLYKLAITDYKGWARGLKAAGYATDKSYAYKLIKIIEDYQLYKYDKNTKYETIKSDKIIIVEDNKVGHEIEVNNGVRFVLALSGDTYQTIASLYKAKVKDLYKYNECDESLQLRPGDIVYLAKKKGKAEKPNFEYVVRSGDSMYRIAQKFGIKVSSLYKMNKMSFGDPIFVGQVLRLR